MDLTSTAETIKANFEQNESIKSFTQFLDDVKNNPNKYCRNSAKYIKDVFDYYGTVQEKDINGDSICRWKLFDTDNPVYGQERAQNAIYNHLCSFTEHKINKIILLHGPNGAAKTSIVSSIMQAVENYSKLAEGAVYTFNWIFSDKENKTESIGFVEASDFEPDTLAFVDSKDITFKLPCSMKDNPLFLIPKKERKQFLDSLGIQAPDLLINGELCQKCHEIYNQLLLAYKGDWLKIIRHIQVERFYFSKRFRKGLVSIDPQKNSDAGSRPLNLENSYRIPSILSMVSLFEPFGDLVDANRCMVEFCELFKRHPETNKYLLTTAEWGTISLAGFTGYLDCVIFATENEAQLSLAKLHPDWPSFNGRLAFVKVPYLLQYSKEIPLYKKTLTDFNRVTKKHIAPHTETLLALWAVVTRLRTSKGKLARYLTHIEKANLYDTVNLPDRWKDDEKKAILSELDFIAEEYEDSREKTLGDVHEDASYEGRSGASYREISLIISQSLYNKENKYLSPLTLFSTISKLAKDDSIYEFFRLPKEMGYLSTEIAIDQLTTYYHELLFKDIRDSSNLIEEGAYYKLFENYIKHVKAWITKEKIQNTQTQAWEDCNENTMNSVEEMINIKDEDIDTWRSSIFKKIAAYSIENPGKPLQFSKIFGDTLNVLKAKTYKKHKDQLLRILKGLLYKDTPDWNLLTATEQTQIEETIKNMLSKGYINESIKDAAVTLLRLEGE